MALSSMLELKLLSAYFAQLSSQIRIEEKQKQNVFCSWRVCGARQLSSKVQTSTDAILAARMLLTKYGTIETCNVMLCECFQASFTNVHKINI